MIGRKVHTVLSFSWHDRWLLLQAWVLLLAVELGLRVLPFRWVQRLVRLGWRQAGDHGADETMAMIWHLRWLVRVAARNHPRPMRCLQRSLALQWLLGRHGIATDLRIGVQKGTGGLQAHAWLEREGQPVGEPRTIEKHFVPLVVCRAGR